MKIGTFILAAALAIGLAGTASASPRAADPAELVQQPGTALEYAKWKGHKGWKGHRGRHYGWYRGRHRGWYKPSRRVYYAPPRRHYGYYPRRHYGSYGYRRPARAVYFRF